MRFTVIRSRDDLTQPNVDTGSAADAVIISLRYGSPEIIEVSYNGAEVETQSDAVALTDPSGANNWDRRTRRLTFVLRRDAIVSLRTVDAVQVSLTVTTTVNDFYSNSGEASFIDRIAFVLNIDPRRVRVMDVVQVSSSTKANTPQTQIIFAIVNEAELSPSATPSPSLVYSDSATPSASPSAGAVVPSTSPTSTPSVTRSPSPTPQASSLTLQAVLDVINTAIASNASDVLGFNASIVTVEGRESADVAVPCTPECEGSDGLNPATCVEGVCVCNDGYNEIGGNTDLELIECQRALCDTNNGGCSDHATCEVVDDTTVRCECLAGYSGNGRDCGTGGSDDTMLAVAVAVPTIVGAIAAATLAVLYCKRDRDATPKSATDSIPAHRVSTEPAIDNMGSLVQPEVILMSPQLDDHGQPVQAAPAAHDGPPDVTDDDFEKGLVEMVRVTSEISDVKE
jgi:hypothetical protein